MTSDRTQRQNEADDLLWQHLKTVPAFRGLLRAVEARFYRQVNLPEPILDVGCGDGHFAGLVFGQEAIAAGIDPWWGPLQKAQKAGAHQAVLQSMGNRLPFPDKYFASAFSNSVLEHIPDVQAVLQETNRVLQPGATLLITMPSHNFTNYLAGGAVLDRLGLGEIANFYRRFFNRISRHAHTDSAEIWARRLSEAGFSVQHWQYYFSKNALRALELGHLQGLPAAIMHFLTGHWILAPWRSSLQLTERWLRPYYEEEVVEEGAYLVIVARKRSDGAVPYNLPPAQALADSLPAGPPLPFQPDDLLDVEAPPPGPAGPPAAKKPAGPTRPSFISRFGPLIMLAAALWGALAGQSILRSSKASPAAALPWLALALLALVPRRRLRRLAGLNLSLARLQALPRRRWLALAGLLLSLMASRQVNGAALQRPAFAFYLWLLAIGLTLFALWPSVYHRPDFNWRQKRTGLAIGGGLFLTALLLRLVNLTGHPFILSGSEASIGLDSWAVVSGQLQNPFATGWLTNPTLLFYIQALPLALFGRSTLAVRILSPFIGALTVPLIYWLGRRFWNREVGLVAAILLAGSHLHIHYSRLGMTSIWDPLLMLLGLGLLYHAWQQPARSRWLMAGLALGAGIYAFTVSHLMPFILAVLLVLWLFDFKALWRRRGHLLATGWLAVVVALPQYLFYRSNPGIFMDRANSVGILQSGWLAGELAGGQRAITVLTDQLWRGLLAFNFGLDRSNLYNSGSSLLSFWPGLLLIIGLGLALWRAGQLRYRLLLTWLGIGLLLGGALLESPPQSHRLLALTPAVYLLIALALAWLVQKFWQLTGRPQRYFVPFLLAAALLLSLGDLSFYFGQFRTEHRFGDRNTEIATVMADYLNELDGSWTAYFHGAPSMYADFPTLPFLLDGDVRLLDVDRPDTETAPVPAGNSVYIYLPERSAELSLVQSQYPGGRMEIFEGYHASPLLYVYEVRP